MTYRNLLAATALFPLDHTWKDVYMTHVRATQVVTVSVFALLWLPMHVSAAL